jgi:protein-S-isoprenylcysteine O-methyltransferase Ste14
MGGNPIAGNACAPEGVNLRPMRKAFWKTTIPSLLYLALALACLIEWRGRNPWSRIDLFSGGYLALRLLGSIHSVVSSREAFRMSQVRQAWWGVDSSPGWTRWVMLLMASDLLVFLDYGHWRLTPGLERSWLQSLGLALYVFAAVWQMLTDHYLAAHFAQERTRPRLIEKGPFRYVRHPRYAGAMVSKVAFALVFSSVLGWLLALAWAMLLTRQVRREEEHLRSSFGAEYQAYAERTARLLPGIY